MQPITPMLWFDGQAEQAANFYVSVFKDSTIHKLVRYGDAGPGPKGTVMTADFSLNGQKFVALNGGPEFKFSSAIAFVVNCDTQEEVDHYWNSLSAGGKQLPCGWLLDQFGLSWNIVPTLLPKLLGDPDPAKSQRVMQAMLKMGKLVIAELQEAYAAS